MNCERGIKFLESRGINLFHAFDTLSVSELVSSAAPEIDLTRFPTTVLIANAGSAFWQSMQQAGVQGIDPVDQYSISLAHEFVKKYLQCRVEMLYPSNHPVSLISFGVLAGWSLTTPMGVTIHPKYGPWFAFRALFLVEKSIPASTPLMAEHPCESCLDKPCQTACPANAVGDIGAFKHETCARFRIRDESICAYQCLSRISCPVGAEYRYVDEQMKYHYHRSRVTMFQYYGSDRPD